MDIHVCVSECVSECVDFAVDQHQSVLVIGVCVYVSAAAVSQLTACTQQSTMSLRCCHCLQIFIVECGA